MNVIVAVVLGIVIIALGFGTLRGFSQPVKTYSPEEAVPVLPQITRITFWCGNCGTEVLLLRKGSDASPRHCGETMVRREEVSRN